MQTKSTIGKFKAFGSGHSNPLRSYIKAIEFSIGHNHNESLTMNVSKLQSHCYVSTVGNNLIVPLNEPRKTDLVPGKLSGTTVFRLTTQAEPSIQINQDCFVSPQLFKKFSEGTLGHRFEVKSSEIKSLMSCNRTF